MVGTRKAGAVDTCTRLTPSNAVNKRGAAVQSTENNSDPRLLERLRAMIVLAEEAGAYELMETSLFPDLQAILVEATTALAAERDRADRAEARLREARKAMDANQTIDGVTDRGWLTPDEWLLDKVAEALGEGKATA